MDMSIAACAALVERGDPDRFLATMAAPPAVREALFPLYAFNLEIARAPFVTEEPMIAEMRLQWWRDVVEEAVAAAPARTHEVAGPLALLIRARGLPAEVFDRAIVARRWDVGRAAFADEDALRAHLEATAGGLAWLGCLACGVEARHEGVVRQAAFAGGLANWFLAVPGYEARGRRPLHDGRPEAVAALARAGLAALTDARGRLPAAAVPVLRAHWQAGAVLRQAARDPGRVGAGRLGMSEFRRRAGLMIRAMSGRW